INNTLRRSAVREAITGDRLLPPELEQQIFQLVATNDPVGVWRHQHIGDTVLVLPQVCRRVQIWIDPFIYERISRLRSYNDARPVPNFLATIKTRPANFFAAHVKYLYFDYTVPLSAVWRILNVRTGVVSVGCHPYLSLAPQLAPLSLQRLCASEFKFPPTPADLPHWAASLTPPGLAQRLPRNPATALAALPALTHLATDYRAVGLGDNIDIPHMRWYFSLDARFHIHLRPIPDGMWDAACWMYLWRCLKDGTFLVLYYTHSTHGTPLPSVHRAASAAASPYTTPSCRTDDECRSNVSRVISSCQLRYFNPKGLVELLENTVQSP
ncbi:hypothetical protein B0H14DRAFT_2711152, partial [Mycena olivaceomarginata]